MSKKAKVIGTTVAVVAVIAIASNLGGSGGKDSVTKPAADTTSAASAAPATSNAPAAPATSKAPATPAAPATSKAPAPPKAPSYTVAEQNAMESAKDYLSMGGGFSRAGLIHQLSSKYGEGFNKTDAVFAVNHIKVNWRTQAYLSAKGYLDTGSFSREGLLQQLTSKYGEQFTHAQATYAVNKVGL